MFVWFLLVLVVLRVFLLLWFEIAPVVCEVERPSELSWRARHGRKKNRHWRKKKSSFPSAVCPVFLSTLCVAFNTCRAC